MKKGFSIFFILTLSIFLCACSLLHRQPKKETKGEAERIQAKSKEIIRCLTEKDKEAFKELFAEKIRGQDGFSEQVEELFTFFECDTYIRSDIEATASGSGSTEYGKHTEWYVEPEIPYIEVFVELDDQEQDSESKYYGLYYYWQIVSEKDASLEGLHGVTVNLLNTNHTVTVGTDELIN